MRPGLTVALKQCPRGDQDHLPGPELRAAWGRAGARSQAPAQRTGIVMVITEWAGTLTSTASLLTR